MILLDIMNETLVNNNNNRKGIIKFLSRPVISVDEKENAEEDSFYTKYDESDFDNFYDETSELARKAEKEEMEKKLIFLSNSRLKNLIYN